MDNQILRADSIEAINRSEVDVSISTAKQYPRDIEKAVNECLTVATKTKGTANECFYALPRRQKQSDGSYQTKMIEGPSVRLAEIIAYSWGNINFGFRIVANDGKKITAQAVCHDLERNIRGQIEVDRRITTKSGHTFNEDMQIVTGNAAGSIALRNAILRVIPKAVLADIVDKIKKVALGEVEDLTKSRAIAVDYFTGLGVDKKKVLATVGKKDLDKITVDDVFTLRAIANAIKEGSTTIEEAFGLTDQGNANDKKVDEEIKKDLEKENLGDIMNKENNNSKTKSNGKNN